MIFFGKKLILKKKKYKIKLIILIIRNYMNIKKYKKNIPTQNTLKNNPLLIKLNNMDIMIHIHWKNLNNYYKKKNKK